MFCRKLAVFFIDHEPEKKLQGPQGIVSRPSCSPVEHILCLEKNIYIKKQPSPETRVFQGFKRVLKDSCSVMHAHTLMHTGNMNN